MMKYLFLLIGLLMFIPYGVQADTSIDITSSKKILVSTILLLFM